MTKLTNAQQRALVALAERGVAHYSNETVIRAADVLLYWQSADTLVRLGLATFVDEHKHTVTITPLGRSEYRRLQREGKL